MAAISEAIKNFTLLFILVAIVMVIIEEEEIHGYLRLFIGVIFLLLILSPVCKSILGQDFKTKVMAKELFREYRERQNLELMLEKYVAISGKSATELLVEQFNVTLAEINMEIKQYECILGQQNELEQMVIYVASKKSKHAFPNEMTKESGNGKRCRELLEKQWNPEFELVVYGEDNK